MQVNAAHGSPPRPIYTAPEGDGRLVPPGWLAHAPVTRALLMLNAAVFLVQLAVTHGASLSRLPTGEALAFGASYSLATLHEARWETLVTACFVHDGIVHIGFNMLALWQAGPLIERAVGGARMAPMYLAAGAIGNLLSLLAAELSHSAQISVGASGAIAGILGAALVVGWRVQGWRGPLTQTMMRWLGFLVVFGILSNLGGTRIDNAAHLGGALAGGAMALTWRRNYRYPPRVTGAVIGACAAVLLACAALVGWQDATNPYATMVLEQRFELAGKAIEAGHCLQAAQAMRAAAHLGAQGPPMDALRRTIQATCGARLDGA